MSVNNLTLHAYDWKYRDSDTDGKIIIMAWCLDRDSKPHLLRFHDFPAYCHVELPLFIGHKRISWTQAKAQQVFDAICNMLGEDKPFKFFFKQAEKLYYYRAGKKYPMMVVLFNTIRSMYNCKNKLAQPFNVKDLGIIACKVWETNIPIVRKLLTLRNVKYCQWFEIQGVKVLSEDKISTLEEEYVVDRFTMNPIPPEKTGSWVTSPRVLSFDIETFSDRHRALPDPYSSKHVVYMISCEFQQLDKPETRRKDLILFGDCNPTDKGNVIKVKSEVELIDTMSDLVIKYDPDVVIGYNIFGYDNPYLDTRLKRRLREWKPMGRLLNEPTKMSSFSWGSSGYGHNEINILEMDGRIMIDLLPLIRRDYKLSLYNLGFVSTYFLGRTKHSITAKEMFETYELSKDAELTPDTTLQEYVKDKLKLVRTDPNVNTVEDVFKKFHVMQYMQKDEHGAKHAKIADIPTITLKEHAMEEMKKVVEYCIVDSELVLDIFQKISCWISLVETANVMGVTMVELFTRGQQLRIQSQVYDEASKDGIVLDERVVPRMEYAGGLVQDPEPGIYHNIPCYDFKSLYPSVMIAHNIDYRTFVPPEMMDKIPDEMCHIIEWDETPEGNEKAENDDSDDETDPPVSKQVKAVHYKYKFVKQDHLLGILPRMLVKLIAERDAVRELQKKYKKNGLEWTILERKQLALKISANSAYGSLGAQMGGKLPLPEGAACVTAKSRESISVVNAELNKKGKVVYGDSVTGDTPILCRATYSNGDQNIFFRPISQLCGGTQLWMKRDDSGKEYMAHPNNLEVWSDKGFTKIKHVMRHKTKKRIYRILTHTGVIKVTEDHSLLDLNGNEISPNQVSVGYELLTKAMPDLPDEGIEIPHAWAWGMFYGDGSCGEYGCESSYKCSWAINNLDLNFLNKAGQLLKVAYPDMDFKILDTVKSSGVYKLVATGSVSRLVREWRELFYDHPSKYKKIPDILWKCSLKTRKEFYEGYYAADGDKDKNGYNRFDNKGQIGAAGLFLLSRSLGYKVSCNTRKDKLDIYRLTLTKSYQRKKAGIIKKIEDFGYIDDYVYDLETENHHFSAGVGELVVHNTDSSMPDLGITDSANAYKIAHGLSKELSALFPPPMQVELEEVFHTMLAIKKKMYLCIRMSKDGKPILERDQLKIRGVVPARRDNSAYQRNSFLDIAWNVLLKKSMYETFDNIINICLRLVRREVPWQDLIVIKGLGAQYKNKSYCMKVFSDELCKIGKPATPGDRLEYLIVKSHGVKDKQLLGYKMRLPSTYLERLESDTPEVIDYEYYLEKSMMNCIQKQLFQIGYKQELNQLKNKYLDIDQTKLFNDLRKQGYTIVANQALAKFDGDKTKAIDFLLTTDMKKIVNPLVTYHIKKRGRISTRMDGEPIKMMIKLIQQKQKCMDVIKTLTRLSEVPIKRPARLQIITPTLGMSQQEIADKWIKTKLTN